jgi:hypothetical protein
VPTIVEIRGIEAPPESPFGEHNFASPDGEWTLSFSRPFEFAMGGYAWDAILLGRAGQGRELPRALDPSGLEPWAFDSSRFAYQAFDLEARMERLHLETTDGRVLDLPTFGYVTEVRWAPNRALLLVVKEDRVVVVREDGSVHADISFDSVEAEPPLAAWLASGDYFFVLNRPGKEESSELRFHSVADGSLVDRIRVDPAELIPYDSTPYDRLRRDYWSLECGPGASAVGSFLERWYDSRYDTETGELLLGVYRPTGPPHPEKVRWGTEWVAPAAPHWIAVKLADGPRQRQLATP